MASKQVNRILRDRSARDRGLLAGRHLNSLSWALQMAKSTRSELLDDPEVLLQFDVTLAEAYEALRVIRRLRSIQDKLLPL